MSENSKRRELKLEDLDKVTGGLGVYATDGKYYTQSEIENFAYDLTQTVGYAVAGQYICQMFGLSTNEMRQELTMEGLLNRLFSIVSGS